MNNFSQHHSHIVKQEVKRRQKKINFVIQIDWTQNSQSYNHMKSMQDRKEEVNGVNSQTLNFYSLTSACIFSIPHLRHFQGF